MPKSKYRIGDSEDGKRIPEARVFRPKIAVPEDEALHSANYRHKLKFAHEKEII